MVGGVPRPLRSKLIRDLWRTRVQVFAIALVVASCIAAVVMASSVRRSLDGTLDSYYAKYRFADLFASAERVPEELAQAILVLPGVTAVETRIVAWGALMPIDMAESSEGE